VFRYGFEVGILAAPIRFGPGFKKPSAKVLRLNRAKAGPRMFERAEVLKLLEHATVNLRVMVLLGLNAALGNTDLALLPIKAVDLGGGWLDYPRSKTGIGRRIPLWPETVAAIKVALADRHPPKDEADAGLLLVGPRGESYIGQHRGYRVTGEFNRVAKKAGMEGRTFYDLRRTFQTIAEGAHDLSAVQAVMGHAPSNTDMSAIYRQRVDDGRLRAVVDHVRRWLFGTEENK
jgi:integrase